MVRRSSIIALVGVACGQQSAVSDARFAPEDLDRVPVVPLEQPDDKCVGHDFPMGAKGWVYDDRARGVPNVPVGWYDEVHGRWQPATVTDESGEYALLTPGPAWIRPLVPQSSPQASCLALPLKLKFQAPPMSTMNLGNVALFMSESCPVRVHVSSDGEPVAEASVGYRQVAPLGPTHEHMALTDSEGMATVFLPCAPVALVAAAEGLAIAKSDECEGVCVDAPGAGRPDPGRPDPDAPPIEIVLVPTSPTTPDVSVRPKPRRRVQVRCAGLAVGCSSMPVACTVGEITTMAICSVGPQDSQECLCDQAGDLVVAAGGRSVRMREDDLVAWIDLRENVGSVTAEVELLPDARCRAWAHLRPGGLASGRWASCTGGALRFEAMAPGTWVIDVTTGPVWQPNSTQTTVVTQVNAGEVTDLGLFRPGAHRR